MRTGIRKSLTILLGLAVVLTALVLAAPAPIEGNTRRTGEAGPSVTVFMDGDRTVSRNTTSGEVLHSSADSSTVIQHALAAIADGGVVQVEAGEYDLARSIAIPSHSRLSGAGAGTVFRSSETTSFQIPEGSDIVLDNFTLLGSGGILIAGYKAPSYNILISDVTATIDDRSEGAFYLLAVDGDVSNVSFVRCSALDCGTNGFMNNGRPGKGAVENVSYLRCEARGTGVASRYSDWVVGFDLAERVDVRNMLLIDCVASSNWQSGFHFEPNVSIANATLVGCVANDNGRSLGAPRGEGYGWGYKIDSQTPQGGIRLVGCAASGNYRGDTSLGPLSKVQE